MAMVRWQTTQQLRALLPTVKIERGEYLEGDLLSDPEARCTYTDGEPDEVGAIC